MNNNVQVNLQFTANTAQAKQELANLQTQLTSLINQPVPIGAKMTANIQKATAAAAELKVHLQNATNVKTGMLDFGKLNASIKQSGMSLSQYGAQLQVLGPQGQQAFMQLANSVAAAEVPIRRASGALTGMMTTFKNTAKWMVSSTVLNGFINTMSSAYNYAQDLNESLNNIRIVTGYNIDKMSKFAAEANKAAKALSTTTTAYTDASLIYYQQGLDDQQVKERTDVTIKMANVSRQSAEVVSDQMTAVWNNFYDGSKSLESYADALTALGAATASSTDEIAQGLEKFAAIADTVGLSYEYATAALATVTAQTRQSADVVGTAFKTLFARMQDLKLGETLEDGTTLGQYSEALNKVGVNIKDANGDLKDMDIILDEIGAKWQNLERDEQAALAKAVGGLRQYNQFIALMDNWDFMQENLKVVENSTGTLQEQADIYAESWEAASKRVQASAEELYNKIFKDEFFIDFTNTIGEAIDFIGQLVDALGGIDGVLLTLGVVITRVFGNQMAQGFNRLIYNLQMSTELGQKMIQTTKASQMEEFAKMMSTSEFSTLSQQTAKDIYTQQLKTQEQMIREAGNLNEFERQRVQLLMDQAKAMGEQTIEIAHQIEALQTRQGTLSSDLKGTGMLNTNQDYNTVNNKFSSLRISSTSFGQINTILSQISAKGEIANEDLQQLRTSINSLQKAGQNVSGLETFISTLQTGDIEVDDFKASMEELQSQMVVISQSQIKSLATFLSGGDTKQVTTITNKLQEYSNIVQDIAGKNILLTNSNKNVKDSYEKMTEIMSAAKTSVSNLGQWMTSLTSAAMSLGMAINSVHGLIDTIKNPDTSGWEKFGAILMSVSMIMMSVTQLGSGAIKVIKGFSAAKIKETYQNIANASAIIVAERAQKKYNKTKAEGSRVIDKSGDELREENIELTKQTVLQKVASKDIQAGDITDIGGKRYTATSNRNGKLIWKDQTGKSTFEIGRGQAANAQAMREVPASSKAPTNTPASTPSTPKGGFKDIIKAAAPALAIAAAVAIIGTTIWAVSEQINAAAKRAEEAATSAAILSQATRDLSDSYKQLNDTHQQYKEGAEGLSKLRKGTVEYKEALLEANDQALNLIRNFEDVKYEVKDGLIVIDDESVEQAQQKALEKQGQAKANTIMAQSSAEKAQLEVNKTNLARELDSEGEWQTTAINAGVAAASEAAAGALIGSVIPGIGTAIGAGVGAIIGGVSGIISGIVATEATGTTTSAEEDALNKISNYVIENGNAVFASEAAFEAMLRDELKLKDEKLIASLKDNMKAVEDLTKVEKERLVLERAEWAAAYGAYQMGNAEYAEHENQEFLNAMAYEVAHDSTKENEIRKEVTDMWSGSNDDFWTAYLKEVMGEEVVDEDSTTGSNYRVTDLGGSNVTLQKKTEEGTWETIGEADSLNEDAAAKQLINARLMAQAADSLNEHLETYDDLSSDLEQAGLENRDILNTVLTDFAEGTAIDLSDINFDDLQKIDVFKIDNIELRDKLQQAIDDYSARIPDIFKSSWYSSLSKAEQDILWTIEFDKLTSIENAREILAEMQAEIDRNALTATITNNNRIEELMGKEILTSEESAELRKLLEQEYKMSKEQIEKFINMSKAEREEFMLEHKADRARQSYRTTEQGVINAKEQVDKANKAEKEARSKKDQAETEKNNAENDLTSFELQNTIEHFALGHDYIDTTEMGNTARTELYGQLTQTNVWGEGIKHEDVLKGITAFTNAYNESEKTTENYLETLTGLNEEGLLNLLINGETYDITLKGQSFENTNQALSTVLSNLVVPDKTEEENARIQEAFSYLIGDYDPKNYDPQKGNEYFDILKTSGLFLNDSQFDHFKTEWNKMMTGEGTDYMTQELFKLSILAMFEGSNGAFVSNSNLDEYNSLITTRDQKRASYSEAVTNYNQAQAASDNADTALKDAENEWIRIQHNWVNTLQELGAIYGLNAEEFASYTQLLSEQIPYVEQLYGSYSNYLTVLENIGIANKRAQKGVEALRNNWDKFDKLMAKSNITLEEYSSILPELSTILKDITNLSSTEFNLLPSDFAKNNWNLISDVVNGVEGSIETLRDKVSDEMLLSITGAIDINSLEQDILTLHNFLMGADDFGLTIGVAFDENDKSGFFDACQQMIAAAAMTKEEAEAYFSSMGFDVEMEQISEPITSTYTYPNVTMENGVPIVGDPPTIEIATTNVASSWALKTITPNGSYGGDANIITNPPPSTKSTHVEKKKKTDVAERYKEVNDQIDNVSRAYENASKAAERLYGKARLNQMKEMNKILANEVDLLAEKRAEAESYLQADQTDLNSIAKENIGLQFEFDQNTGDIINYQKVMDAVWKDYDAYYESAKSGGFTEEEQERLENYDKAISTTKEAVAQYDETRELLEDIDDEIQAKLYEMQDNNYEMFTYQIDMELEIRDLKLDLNQYKIDSIMSDLLEAFNTDKYAQNIYNLVMEGVDAYRIWNDETQSWDTANASRISQLQSDFAKGEAAFARLKNGEVVAPEDMGISQANYADGLKNEYQYTMDNINALKEKDELMQSYYGDTLAAANEEIEKYTSLMEHSANVLDHYKNLMELTGKGTDYKKIGKILEGEAQVAADTLAVSTAVYEDRISEAEAAWEAYQNALTSGASEETLATLKNTWLTAQSAANEAQEQMLSDTEAWAEAQKAILENSLADLGKTLEKLVTGKFGSYDELSAAIERATARTEEWLTNTNKIYETNKLMNKAQQEIDKTSNTVAKRKLQNFMKETQELQKQSKLSNFELEVQQAKYDLLLAEIALEEAQNAKSMVRLQRDNEGNFGYIYTADQKAIEEAEQKRADADNNLYKIRLEGANKYGEKLLTLRQNYDDTMNDLNEKFKSGEMTAEEYTQAANNAKTFYYDQMEQYSYLYGLSIAEDARITADAWSTEFQDMILDTEGWKNAVEDYVGDVKDAFSNWTGSISSLYGPNGVLSQINKGVQNIVDTSTELRILLVGTDGTSGIANDTALASEKALALATEYAKVRDTIIGEGGLIDAYKDQLEDITTLIEDLSNLDNTSINVNQTQTYKTILDTGNFNAAVKDFSAAVDRLKGEEGIIGPSPSKPTQEEINWAKANGISGFDTGGYTGEWGPEGKLGLLHQKELILNKDDTSNFLSALGLLDNILLTLDKYSVSAQLGGLLSSPAFNMNNHDILEQNVHIEASFPGVSDRNEIEEAFNNLINRASQYANRK